MRADLATSRSGCLSAGIPPSPCTTQGPVCACRKTTAGEKRTFASASVQYNINDNWALTFDAVNLTDTEIRQFAGNASRPRAAYRNGPLYWLGVRINY